MSSSSFTNNNKEYLNAYNGCPPSSKEDSMGNYEHSSESDSNASDIETTISHYASISPSHYTNLADGIGNMMFGRYHCPEVPEGYNWDETRDFYPDVSFNSKLKHPTH
ncbi:unnamed protein product [Linum trigynum]|uniref:Uncharacterized protein n=1 Tax=Linum trigynum TaxID=586398 RepID=A0AAV2EC79_9ROSI